MPKVRRPVARIDFSPKPAQQKLFERAAALEGETLTEFLIRSAEELARRVIQEHETFEQRGHASARFIDLLLNPPAPNARLRKAFEQHEREAGGDA